MNNKDLITCKVLKDFKSPKNNGESVIYKEFKVGQKVVGNLVSSDMFKTKEGFVLPKKVLKPLMQNANGEVQDEIDYAEIIEDEPKKTFVLPKDIKANMGNFLKVKSKTAVNGAVTGLVVGLIYAMYSGKSKLVFSVVGSVGGFVLGNLYNNYINEDLKKW